MLDAEKHLWRGHPTYPSYSKLQSTGLIHSHPMAGARMPPVATVMNAMVQESLIACGHVVSNFSDTNGLVFLGYPLVI